MANQITLALDPATHRLYLPAARFAFVPEAQKNAHPAMMPGRFTIIVMD